MTTFEVASTLIAGRPDCPLWDSPAIYALFKRPNRRQNKNFRGPFQIERLTTQPLRLFRFQAAPAAAEPVESAATVRWPVAWVRSDAGRSVNVLSS